MSINFIDLFSGAGGLTTGLIQAGLNHVMSCDFNSDAVQSLNLNYPNSLNLYDKVENLNKRRLQQLIGNKKIHLVAGGPPCQGFSTIGLGNPNDERNSMFKYFLKVIKNLDPEFILFENVTGLLSKKNELTLKEIIKRFNKLGYLCKVEVMQAQHYGVAQKRRRLIIVGHKENYKFTFPKKTHDVFVKGKYSKPKVFGDYLKQLKGNLKSDEIHDLDNSMKLNSLDLKRIKRIPEGGKIRYEKDEKKYLTKSLKLNVDWSKIREGRLRENHYHRISRKEVAPTVNTHNHHYFHPIENRKLTLRELALIQSFPVDYKFFGSRTSIIRQIGNAVPPILAKALGKELKKSLKSTKSSGKDKSAQNQYNLLELRSKAFRYV